MNYYLISSRDSYISTRNDRSVYGELFMEIGDLIFPNKGWEDIISSVLDMWIDNISSLLKSKLGVESEFCFMDGPYSFKVFNVNEEMINIDFYEDDVRLNTKTYQISFNNFLFENLKVISYLIKDERFEKNDSIEGLKRKYVELKKIAKNRGYLI